MPYLHDGRLPTHHDTVKFFNLVLGLQLTRQEKEDLVAYISYRHPIATMLRARSRSGEGRRLGAAERVSGIREIQVLTTGSFKLGTRCSRRGM